MPGEDQSAIPVSTRLCHDRREADGHCRSEKLTSHLPAVLGAGAKSSAFTRPSGAWTRARSAEPVFSHSEFLFNA